MAIFAILGAVKLVSAIAPLLSKIMPAIKFLMSASPMASILQGLLGKNPNFEQMLGNPMQGFNTGFQNLGLGTPSGFNAGAFDAWNSGINSRNFGSSSALKTAGEKMRAFGQFMKAFGMASPMHALLGQKMIDEGNLMINAANQNRSRVNP